MDRTRPPEAASWKIQVGETLALLAELPDAHVDAVVADPPYSSGGCARDATSRPPSQKYVSTGARVAGPDFAGDNRDQRSYGWWSALWLSEALRVSKPGGVVAVFTDWRQLPTVTDAVQAGGWIWRGIVPWRKPLHRARPKRGAFRNQAEYVVWGTAGAHRPAPDAPYLPGVLEGEPPPASRRIHITEKPVEVLEQLVQVAPPGGLVLDPFAGSGTTGVAALRCGRRFLGFERHAQIARQACERIASQDTDRKPATRPRCTRRS